MSLEHGEPHRRGWNASWPQVGVPAGNLLAAGVLGGALAPIISIALLDRFDSALPVAIYVLAGLVVTIVSVWLAPETSRIDLHEEPADERKMVQDRGSLAS
jgi:zinc transporter ZupT